MATVLLANPSVEIQAPSKGFDEATLNRIAGYGGIVVVVGINRGKDGRFGAVRIYFSDDEAMDAYLAALPSK